MYDLNCIMINLGIILFLTFSLNNCDSLNVQSLDGDWLLKAANGKYVDLKATVPGGIYTDLMNNNIIGDILYGYNDRETKWVPRLNWTYYRTFSVDEDILNQENIHLVFDGLDTFSSIYVNDEYVGESENMFLQYIFDVKKQIKLGENKIEVRFLSPIEVASQRAEEQNKLYDIPLDCPPDAYRGECHANMIRKMQASFSWDWGPAFPSVGIWKNIYIESYDESAIRYVVADVTDSPSDDSWDLNIDTYLMNNWNLTQVFNVTEQPNSYGEIVSTISFKVAKSNVNYWWPNGFGGHDLYNLRVTFADGDSSEFDSKVIRIGFRTVEIVQESIGSGLSFYFKINGIPIFMKGSNEIPIDILPERGQNKTTIKKLLKTVQNSHMNMLRVWGGGVYESDYFYDLADELGILIWQDFMFACSMYQADDIFLNNINEEVRHQVKRLSSHPSIALFAGNNENEGALADNWYGTNSNFSLYKNDYVKLYIDTIEVEFDRITHQRGIFISSSPSDGNESKKQGYVATNPGDTLFGDVHYYNYVLDPWDSNVYPVTRFASEYGYQSFPSVGSLLKATNTTDDLNINSKFMDHRQHHPGGNAEIQLLMDWNLNMPPSNGSKYYEAFIYYSQIMQAMSIKVESEHYRRFRNNLNNKGEGNTMGALYWQLNDVWLAPTWSGIDYTGKWKMLQYHTQEFFAPIIITGHINVERTLDIYIVSDLLSPVLGVTAVIRVYHWNSLEPLSTESLSIDLEAGHSHLIKSLQTDNYLNEKKCGALNDARNYCFFYLSLEKDGAKVAPDNFVFPEKLKNSHPQQAKVQIVSVENISNEGVYQITIATDKAALFVWLDTVIQGTFSDNGFLLVNSTQNIYFTSEENTTAEELSKSLTITHLLDEQYFQ
ncbi:unnamed protein product [Phaedon cochleariae]|uniref:beta-mannosidase n=1 Tax=Phaedon cochleariae TaxID=80249 RepID=A0A9N9SAX5_PHACE|nr:unnamed protein product [Phaedon cochleariae]